MDLSKLTKLVGKPITINRIQIYTDNAYVVECIQGILKEIKAHSISIEQCFTDQDYIETTMPHTTREFINNEFDLAAPII